MEQERCAEDDIPQSKRDRFTGFLKQGIAHGKDELEHALGLGHQPNVIPPGEANSLGELRTVEIGWHPVAGMGGKWFAEKTGLGKMITNSINHYPDPTQHWAVLVGDFCHELWMDEDFHVIYINEKLDRNQWHTYEVGKTRFNDEALRQAGEMVIYNMRAERAAYNLISNNCQNFATLLLDSIQVGAHRQFATTFAVYQRATGRGAIKDLFAIDVQQQQQQQQHDDEVQQQLADPNDSRPPQLQHQNTLQYAQQVMDEHTTKLDTHRPSFFSRFSGHREGESDQ